MTCKDLEFYLADKLTGRITDEDHRQLHTHLQQCERCRQASLQISTLWEKIKTFPETEPGPALRSRFYTMLAEEKNRLQNRISVRSRMNHWLSVWWPKEPAVQFALTCGLVILTILLSGHLTTDSHQIAELQQDVRDMRQTLSVSLLQEESASDRLQGIQLVRQVSRPSASLMDRLIDLIDNDQNINVRLAAVDAVYLFANRPDLTDRLTSSLQNQSSPLVQIALIDLMSDIRARQAVDALKSLIGDDTVEQDVRHHAQDRLNRMM